MRSEILLTLWHKKTHEALSLVGPLPRAWGVVPTQSLLAVTALIATLAPALVSALAPTWVSSRRLRRDVRGWGLATGTLVT